MGELFNSYSTFLVLNSITNDLDDEKFDLLKPFSFLEYLNYSKSIDSDIENFKQYEIYIKKWNNTGIKKNNDYRFDVRDQYISLFRDINLKFSSPDERRYLQTINFNNKENLTIAIPFYAKKIKEISLYFKERRNTFTKELRELKDKGSIDSIENYTKGKILDLFEGDNSVTTSLPLSILQVNLDIEIEEGYDVFNDYYDLDPEKLPDFYNATLERKDYFSSNTNFIKENQFLDLNKAIIDLINSKNITLEELGEFSPIVDYNNPDTELLDGTDYINYKKNNRDNLKILFEADLVKKLIGTDYYFLSTNSNNEILSGVLFEGENKVNNLLNINYPASFTIPVTSNKFEREVGNYFKPTNFSILKMKGSYNYSLKENLSSNAVYVFPNPNSFGGISNLSKTLRDNPYKFELKDDIYKNSSSSIGRKLVKSDYNDQNFYSYNSFEQYRNISNTLSSFSTPFSNLVNTGIIENINFDIFGNRYVEYINDNSYVQNFKKDSIVNNKTSFIGSNTLSTNLIKSDKLNFNSKKISKKTVFVQNISTNEYQNLSTAYSNLFEKYKSNSLLYSDLLNSVKNINVYDNTFSIDTENFSLIDSFNYDGNFRQTTDLPLIIPVKLTDDTFTGVSNDYVKENKLYKVIINLMPENVFTESATISSLTNKNNHFYYYEFFSYDLNKKVEVPIINRKVTPPSVFTRTFNLTGIGVTPKRLRNTTISFSSKLNTFNLLSQFNDLNDNTYLHNFLYKIFNNRLEIIDNSIYTPTNNFRTTSFFTSAVTGSNYYDTVSLSGDLIQDFEKGILFL